MGPRRQFLILKKSQLQLLDGMAGRGRRVMRREKNGSLKSKNGEHVPLRKEG